MNPWLLLVLALLVAEYLLDTVSELLNMKRLGTPLPAEFDGLYDPAKYRKSQDYQRELTRFQLVRNTFLTALVIAFVLAGGFDAVDLWARSFGRGEILTGLLFAAALMAIRFAVSLPFSLYFTFDIESRYGFNRTTPATYASDIVKGAALTAILGAPVFAGIVYFFGSVGPNGWLYAWIAVTLFQLAVLFVAPVLLMPLFNRYEPLEEGALKQSIDAYARSRDFQLSGIYKMDGSRRSTKANAFFTGFGRFRRLVLFDTLIAKQTPEELVAVVAHEVGHFKLGHIPKSIALSIAGTGVMFFVLSRMIGNPWLFAAFRMENVSVYASIIFISVLFSPVSRFLSLATNGLSRKFEFEADRYSHDTYGRADALITSLKKLSVDHLSELAPHRLKVLLDYSHPPVLERIAALRALAPTK